ncbi:PDZ domain-containing protein [Nocardia panacis]|uniref:PDZ domain-containing protein n=1 Tax=Nocardia panacis TaxID=2340916 RepID=A0A3A4KEU8_9NOCA|nr:trypsin-like peptidase domain-containing protein [Nocardia panacis]RJO79238.1 PDZ domain-containing protein [Nocardia panacis]
MSEQDRFAGSRPEVRAATGKSRRTAGLALGAAALALGIGAAAAGLGYARHEVPRQPAFAQSQFTAQPATYARPADMRTAAAQVAPGLVDVNTELGMQGARGAGTGIVLSADGAVLTNNHVVAGATDISVTDIGNGQTYRATVVGYDRADDIAVLKLANASGLTTAPLGDSDKVAVGDAVAGVGNAGGVGGPPSMAAGRVTALNRVITASDESSGSSENLNGLIQVAANIQPGDSGGPLVSADGKVVGMDTAASAGYRFSQVSTGGGQGFAIPINRALAVARDIKAGNASESIHIGSTAFLGVTVSDAQGALVRGVVRDGPADRAGIAPGSLITAVNGHPVDSATTLTHLLDATHPGDTAAITWLDLQSQTRSGSATLATGPVG